MVKLLQSPFTMGCCGIGKSLMRRVPRAHVRAHEKALQLRAHGQGSRPVDVDAIDLRHSAKPTDQAVVVRLISAASTAARGRVERLESSTPAMREPGSKITAAAATRTSQRAHASFIHAGHVDHPGGPQRIFVAQELSRRWPSDRFAKRRRRTASRIVLAPAR